MAFKQTLVANTGLQKYNYRDDPHQEKETLFVLILRDPVFYENLLVFGIQFFMQYEKCLLQQYVLSALHVFF